MQQTSADKINYIRGFIEVIQEGGNVQLLSNPYGSFILTAESPEEMYYLEVLADNRFGRELDS